MKQLKISFLSVILGLKWTIFFVLGYYLFIFLIFRDIRIFEMWYTHIWPIITIIPDIFIITEYFVEDYKKKKMEEELKLALEAVETLRSELNEVNLLNAKLLYVNKIFKAKNLNESQKLTVIKAFDKAESAKEAKLVYESLSTTFNAKSEKRQIKESLGFASKPAGVAAKQTIVESNDFVARMQKLANIK